MSVMSAKAVTSVIRARDTRSMGARLFGAIVALVDTAIRYRTIWKFLSVQDIKSRFRRSRLGVLWMIMNQVVFACGAGYMWAIIFGQKASDFIPFISVGFAVWGFIAAGFVDGCNAFVSGQGFAKQVALPMEIFICRFMANTLFTASFGMLTAVIIVVLTKDLSALPGMIWVFPGLALVIVCVIFVTGTMAYLGAIYRDLLHGMSGLFQMLFVVSPVIYTPEILIKRGAGFLIFLNPLASMIQVIRVPIIEQHLALRRDYLMVVAMTLFFMMTYAALRSTFGRRIVYYL